MISKITIQNVYMYELSLRDQARNDRISFKCGSILAAVNSFDTVMLLIYMLANFCEFNWSIKADWTFGKDEIK